MKRNVISAAGIAWAAGLLLWLSGATASAQSATMKFEVLLIWGTNDPQSPDPKYKPVDPDIRRQLVNDVPLKWANYFQICKKHVEVPTAAEKKTTMSDKCEIRVRNLGEARVQVSFFGKGTDLLKREQKMPVGRILVFGGNAPNATAWLVTLKRVE